MVMRKTAGRASTKKEPAQTRGKEQSDSGLSWGTTRKNLDALHSQAGFKNS